MAEANELTELLSAKWIEAMGSPDYSGLYSPMALIMTPLQWGKIIRRLRDFDLSSNLTVTPELPDNTSSNGENPTAS